MTAKEKSTKLNSMVHFHDLHGALLIQSKPRLLGHTIVHIKVGDDLKDFGIHKDLICHHSPYFKAAFNSGFEESITGVMKLPETEPEIFELFYYWLYTQALDMPPWDPNASKVEAKCKNAEWCHCNSDKVDSHGSNSGAYYDDDCPAFVFYKEQIKTLVMLYIFADMARIPILQNNCLEKFFETTERANYVPIEQLAYIWQHTHETSLLRKALIDMLTWEFPPDDFFAHSDTIPNVVKDEVLASMSRCIARILPLTMVRSPLENVTNYYVKVE